MTSTNKTPRSDARMLRAMPRSPGARWNRDVRYPLGVESGHANQAPTQAEPIVAGPYTWDVPSTKIGTQLPFTTATVNDRFWPLPGCTWKELIVRCLIAHKWVMGKTAFRYLHAYRTCERCGIMQRSIYDAFWRDTAWETMRERTYIKSYQLRIVRRPSSWLDRLSHTIGLRRTRRGDRRQSRRSSALARN